MPRLVGGCKGATYDVSIRGDFPCAIEGAGAYVADEIARGRGTVGRPQGRGAEAAAVDELGVLGLGGRGDADGGGGAFDKVGFERWSSRHGVRGSLVPRDRGAGGGQQLDVLGFDDGVDGKGAARLALTSGAMTAMDDEGGRGSRGSARGRRSSRPRGGRGRRRMTRGRTCCVCAKVCVVVEG